MIIEKNIKRVWSWQLANFKKCEQTPNGMIGGVKYGFKIKRYKSY